MVGLKALSGTCDASLMQVNPNRPESMRRGVRPWCACVGFTEGSKGRCPEAASGRPKKSRAQVTRHSESARLAPSEKPTWVRTASGRAWAARVVGEPVRGCCRQGLHRGERPDRGPADWRTVESTGTSQPTFTVASTLACAPDGACRLLPLFPQVIGSPANFPKDLDGE
jgi:hypothetical protein